MAPQLMHTAHYCRGVRLLDQQGSPRLVYPSLVAELGDLQALSGLLLVSSAYTCAMPDASYLVPQDKLDDATTAFPKRTEAKMLRVIAEAQSLAQQEPPDNDRAKAWLAKYSLSKVLLFDPSKSGRMARHVEFLWVPGPGQTLQVTRPALAGFFATDCYEIVPPDRLHSVDKGISDYMVNPDCRSGVMKRLLEDAHGGGASELRAVRNSPGPDTAPRLFLSNGVPCSAAIDDLVLSLHCR